MAESQETKVDQEPEIENLDDAAKKAEEEGLKGKSEEEVRAQILKDYDLDEDDDSDLIDKLTKDKITDLKRLGTAINQKIKYRTKLNEKPPEKKEEIKIEEKKDDKGGREEVDKLVDEKLDKRDLDALEVSDDLKKEIKNYAQLHKMPIKQAIKSNYIQYLKDQEDKKAKSEEAANGGKSRSQTKTDFSEKSPSDFDLTTEEGRKDWDSYKKWLKTQK